MLWQGLNDLVVLCLFLTPLASLALNVYFSDIPWRLGLQRLQCAVVPEVPLIPAQNNTGLERVHVVWSGEDYHFLGILTSMISTTRHLRDPGSCAFHVIVSPQNVTLAEKIASCFAAEFANFPTPNRARPSIHIHSIRSLPFDVSGFRFQPHATLAQSPYSWVRFYLHEYLPNVRRAIWLDTDVIVKADLAPLYIMEMTTPLAATRDYTMDVGMNSGVLVLDLWVWKYIDMSSKLEEMVGALASGRIPKPGGFCDQNVLNMVFRGHHDILDWRWNVVGMAVGKQTWTSLTNFYKKGLFIKILSIWVMNWITQTFCGQQVRIQHFNWGPKYWITRNPTYMGPYIDAYTPRFCWEPRHVTQGTPNFKHTIAHGASKERPDKVTALR